MTTPAIRQWCSTSGAGGSEAGGSRTPGVPPRCLANEIVRAPNDTRALTTALDRASTDEKGLGFLILGAQDLTPGVLQLVLEQRLTHPRVTLAADLATLEHFGAQISDGRIGLMLDNVDVETPLSSIVWEHLEAIRFSQAYVTRASRDLRTSCALECMIALAKDLGLCTFGPSATASAEGFPNGRGFDYLPYSSASRSAAVGTLRTTDVSHRSALNTAFTR